MSDTPKTTAGKEYFVIQGRLRIFTKEDIYSLRAGDHMVVSDEAHTVQEEPYTIYTVKAT